MPFALVLGGFIGGFYKLMKSIIFTYEKINRDKRNTSAIMAITNQLSEKINKEAMAIISGDKIDFDNEESIKTAREAIKWTEISNYFARMHESGNVKDGEVDGGDGLKQIDTAVNIVEKITGPIISAIKDKK